MTNYRKRDRDDPLCSAPRCLRPWETRYLEGATGMNPNMDVQLCDIHHEEFRNRLSKVPANRTLKVLKHLRWKTGNYNNNEETGHE
tara:strand:+ start:113 stop:370 length:258 start_codon:yes stop_codon:yes gene_type:complete